MLIADFATTNIRPRKRNVLRLTPGKRARGEIGPRRGGKEVKNGGPHLPSSPGPSRPPPPPRGLPGRRIIKIRVIGATWQRHENAAEQAGNGREFGNQGYVMPRLKRPSRAVGWRRLLVHFAGGSFGCCCTRAVLVPPWVLLSRGHVPTDDGWWRDERRRCTRIKFALEGNEYELQRAL